MWPWGRRERRRRKALPRAEAALREASAGFYEVEVTARRITFVRDELVRLLDEGIGLSREAMGGTLESAKHQAATLDASYAGYFADLDAWTPLDRHPTAAELTAAAEVFERWTRGWDEVLDAGRGALAGLDHLLDVLAEFRTVCRPVVTAASRSMSAARGELNALAGEGVTSRPLRRSLREAEGALERLADGRASVMAQDDVASYARRLHAEAEDIRRRVRRARPRMALLAAGPE